MQSACGENHSLVLTETGDVYAFGLNDYGKLGIHTIHISEKVESPDPDKAGALKLELQPRPISVNISIFIIIRGSMILNMWHATQLTLLHFRKFLINPILMFIHGEEDGMEN